MCKVIIAGCGYVGGKLAESFLSSGLEPTVLVNSESSYRKYNNRLPCYRFDLDSDQIMPALDYSQATIFYFIPPSPAGAHDQRIVRFLRSISEDGLPEKIVLISTTGVYGNCGDEWVDETREPNPQVDRARRRLHAEQTLSRWCNDYKVDYIILRVPGIYGQDKLPLKRIRDRTPVLALAESPWSNRIHVDDLVQACVKAMDYKGMHHVFNVSDGHPSSMTDYFLSVARALGMPEPPQISLQECKQQFSDNMISYLLESKKIDNKRLLQDLGVELKYPELEDGLKTVKS